MTGVVPRWGSGAGARISGSISFVGMNTSPQSMAAGTSGSSVAADGDREPSPTRGFAKTAVRVHGCF